MKFLSFCIKTVVFLIFLGWLSFKFLLADLETASTAKKHVNEKPAAGSGLIVPAADPRFR
ncbi:hypothetical protein GAO09_29055 [Rhizobiales bacterium RZME27]|uniref:Uncharacterized protein n=1 Tax=Endobacterium cereale TaxID=2663029 RepID=A0A6A8AGX1_9HYPH|nr:hypothetical protein [Endobacterium cereale]MQY50084.1 hypothetical protein [Endobacterium cereale]